MIKEIQQFTFYKNYYDIIRYLNDEDKLLMLNTILEFVFEDKEPVLSGLNLGIWNNIKMPLTTTKNNIINGKKGGAPKGNNNAKKTTEKQPKNNQKTTENTTEKQANNISNFYFLISNFLFLKDKDILKNKIEEWLEYKKQRKDKPYTEIGFKKLLTQIENNVNKYGEEQVIELIDECMSNNYQGIIFDKLKVRKPKIQELPSWFDKKTENEELTAEEEKEYNELLKEINF